MNLEDIKSYYKNKRIKCQKYNSALEEIVQNQCSFNSFMIIQDDQIAIYNIKPQQVEENYQSTENGESNNI